MIGCIRTKVLCVSLLDACLHTMYIYMPCRTYLILRTMTEAQHQLHFNRIHLSNQQLSNKQTRIKHQYAYAMQ